MGAHRQSIRLHSGALIRMFSPEQLISDCRRALHEPLPERAIKEIVQRAIAAPAEVLCALGPPAQSGLFPVYQAPELTILNVIWAPGMSLYPHDHRMWAVIGVYGGTEDNVFYKRTLTGLARASSKRLETGDATLLGSDSVHAVTNPLGTFTGAIQIYGGDFFRAARSEFDPETLKERPFDLEKAKRVFLEANSRLQR
jgi:predicted metal-dependent enzyme (double-stranded beta helix superfamily)